MKFTIAKTALKNVLDIVTHATAGITTSPILENILIKVHFQHIVFSSNNLEMAIECIVKEGINIVSEWSFCVPAKLFSSYVTLIDEDEIEIELLGNENLQIKTTWGKTKIKGKDAEEFPLIPRVKEEISIKMNGWVMKKAIEKTLFSSAEGNIRPTLAWIYVNIQNTTASFASTDSFRLTEYKTELGNSAEHPFSQIIPNKTAFEIKSIIKEDDEITIVSGENQIGFFFGEVKVYSRLLNGKFPDYDSANNKFFPTKFATRVEVNRFELMQALKKINLISRENNYSIKISCSSENGLLIETSQTQIGEGEIKVQASVEGENNIIWINSTYFLEVLSVIESSHIQIGFETTLSPILITPIDEKKTKAQFRHIIMPLKI
jgi:DNA polymerase III subunit beta